jgi:hypothetical protein
MTPGEKSIQRKTKVKKRCCSGKTINQKLKIINLILPPGEFQASVY